MRGEAAHDWVVPMGKDLYRVGKAGKAKPGWSDGDGRLRRFDETGKLLRGVWLLGDGFYAADGEGFYLADATAALKSAAQPNQPARALRELLGEPSSEYYSASCAFAGKDGIWDYDRFCVLTALPDSGDSETVSSCIAK